MANFSELKTDISNYLGESYLDTQVGDAINRAIRFYQRRRFWFNEESTSITLTASDPVVPSLPSDFQYEIPDGGLVIVDNQSYYRLRKVGNAEYDANNTQGIGRPTMYRNRDSQLEVYFYPDQAYTLNLYYVKNYTALSADGDSNDFTNNAEELIKNKALAYLYETYRKDAEKAVYFRQVAKDELDDLLVESNNRTTTGTLVIEDITLNNNYINTNLNCY